LTEFCETGTRRRCMFSRIGILDVRPATSADSGGDSDGRDVDAGCGSGADLGDDVGVADAADATGDAVPPADADAGRNFDDGKPFRLTHTHYRSFHFSISLSLSSITTMRIT